MDNTISINKNIERFNVWTKCRLKFFSWLTQPVAPRKAIRKRSYYDPCYIRYNMAMKSNGRPGAALASLPSLTLPFRLLYSSFIWLLVRALLTKVKTRARFSRTQIQKEKNIHFGTVKLLTKFVIITYVFGSVHEKFGVLRKERLSRSKLTVGVPNWFRRENLSCT